MYQLWMAGTPQLRCYCGFYPGGTYRLSRAYKNDCLCVPANSDYGFYVAREALVICYMGSGSGSGSGMLLISPGEPEGKKSHSLLN